jgi:enoyl-CoA hydratase/carnithine racemase
MLRRAAANPQAATVLVQVLRAIEHLSPEDGLVVESLGYAALQSGDEFRRWLNQYRSQNPAAPVKGSGPAVLSERSGDRLNLVLNRPESDNAYSVEMRDALTELFRLVALDGSIREVTVTGAGRCFCTGGALTEFGTVSSATAAHMIRSKMSPAKLLLSSADRYHFHVHKACVGSGIELPACAARLTAAPKTVFWLPELSMGLIPGAGGCVSIARRIGRRRTAYLVLMNKKIDANKALEWGLIDEIVS